MQLWESENKYLIEKYYETYLFSVKYILGYSVEALKIAKDYEKEDNTCGETARDVIKMNLNPTITKDIYETY